MRIGLFGQFGSGNLGNDGSLEVAIALLKRMRPDAELVCICPGPAVVEGNYGIHSAGIASEPAESPAVALLNRLLLNVPRHLRNLVRPIRHTRNLDVLIVPGTGILDDFCETPFGWPYVILRWCVAARLNRVPIYFLSIGAGPIRHGLSRLFLISAARLATWRSYRDQLSREFMRSAGLDVRGDRINCDLAFRLPVPIPQFQSDPASITVGVGIMNYGGWTKAADVSRPIHEAYIAKMQGLVSWLLDRGMRVRLLIGGAADNEAVRDLMGRLGGPHADLVAKGIGSLQQLMVEIAQTDVVVATRYHNVVCALSMERPTISLGYARKNDELLQRAGLGAYCHDVETFDPEAVKRQLLEIVDRREAIRPGIRQAVEGFRVALDEQAALLCRRLRDLDPVSTEAGALPCPDHGHGCPS